MKRVLVSCLFVLVMMWLPLPGLSGQTGGGATTSNKQGKLDELLAIAAGGTNNADLYYNIGVCYFEAGKPGKATLYYLKALGVDSAHKPAHDNLKYMQDLLFADSTSESNPFLDQLFVRIYDFFSTDRLCILSLILALFTVLSLHWLIHYPTDRERALPLLLVMACVVLLLGVVVFLFVKQHRIRTNDTAVVVATDSQQFETADGSQPSDRVAVEGTIVHVIGKEGSYSHVRLPDGSMAWLKTSDIDMVIENK